MGVIVSSDATDLFFSLTPDKVLEAVEAAGMRTNPVCYALNSYENRVYEVELDSGDRVVAKFYRPGRWSEEQILEEHRFLADLDDAEVPVCPVLPFSGGGTLRRVEGIFYCIFDRRGGRAPDEMTEVRTERLGMLAARIHNTGVRGDAPGRLRLNGTTYVRDNVAWMSEAGAIPDTFLERYTVAAGELADLADGLLEGVEIHRIHGDFHLGNIIERSGLYHVLDFDDMLVGPAVQDFWLLLPGRDPETERLRELFIVAYEQLRAFDRRTLRLIEPLRGLRMVHYTAWIARRWHDPAFPATWPHFGTEQYWFDATYDLEELVEGIRTGKIDPELPSPEVQDEAEEEPPELTNKDYFWDWEED